MAEVNILAYLTTKEHDLPRQSEAKAGLTQNFCFTEENKGNQVLSLLAPLAFVKSAFNHETHEMTRHNFFNR